MLIFLWIKFATIRFHSLSTSAAKDVQLKARTCLDQFRFSTQKLGKLAANYHYNHYNFPFSHIMIIVKFRMRICWYIALNPICIFLCQFYWRILNCSGSTIICSSSLLSSFYNPVKLFHCHDGLAVAPTKVLLH